MAWMAAVDKGDWRALCASPWVKAESCVASAKPPLESTHCILGLPKLSQFQQTYVTSQLHSIPGTWGIPFPPKNASSAIALGNKRKLL